MPNNSFYTFNFKLYYLAGGSNKIILKMDYKIKYSIVLLVVCLLINSVLAVAISYGANSLNEKNDESNEPELIAGESELTTGEPGVNQETPSLSDKSELTKGPSERVEKLHPTDKSNTPGLKVNDKETEELQDNDDPICDILAAKKNDGNLVSESGYKNAILQLDESCKLKAAEDAQVDELLPPSYVTIVVDKIVCTDESDLPNWGNSGPDMVITSDTAHEWVDDQEHESCDFEEGWQFQWTSTINSQPTNPGDNTGEAGLPWYTFGLTDADGRTSVTLSSPTDIPWSHHKIWIREVFQNGYIPFTYGINNDNSNDVSAEIYCYEDVLNYDNLEWINKVYGSTRYCVAFNVPLEYCGDNITQTNLGEECDDANDNNGDGCTDECLIACPNLNLVIDFTDVANLQEGDVVDQTYVGDDANNPYADGAVIPLIENGIPKTDLALPQGDGDVPGLAVQRISDSSFRVLLYGSHGGEPFYSAEKAYGILTLENAAITDVTNDLENPIEQWGDDIWADAPSQDEVDWVFGGNQVNFYPTVDYHNDGFYVTYDCFTQPNNDPVCGNGLVDGNEECDGQPGCTQNCVWDSCIPGVELVMNGGFETPVVTNDEDWDIFDNGEIGLEWSVGWRSDEGQPEPAKLELQKVWTPYEGDQYAELDTDWNGPGRDESEPSSVRISQYIPTIPGENYTVRFAFSPRPGTDGFDNRLKLNWDHDDQIVFLSADGSTNDDTVWTPYEYTFIADSLITNLAFIDVGDQNSLGTFLDDVSVKCANEGPYCGNGILEGPNEVCDDGANNGQYGYCNAYCTGMDSYCGDDEVDENYEECETASDCGEPERNGEGYVCSQCTCMQVQGPYCGDNEVNQDWEQCDDGNTNNDDGCDANCQTEEQLLPYCGDGEINQGWEQCEYDYQCGDDRSEYICSQCICIPEQETDCIDADQDGYYGFDEVLCLEGNDCNDGNPAINPGATEVCNQIDDNCNAFVDEGDVCTPPTGGPGAGDRDEFQHPAPRVPTGIETTGTETTPTEETTETEEIGNPIGEEENTGEENPQPQVEERPTIAPIIAPAGLVSAGAGTEWYWGLLVLIAAFVFLFVIWKPRGVVVSLEHLNRMDSKTFDEVRKKGNVFVPVTHSMDKIVDGNKADKTKRVVLNDEQKSVSKSLMSRYGIIGSDSSAIAFAKSGSKKFVTDSRNLGSVCEKEKTKYILLN